jgi:hypothetical protein
MRGVNNTPAGEQVAGTVAKKKKKKHEVLDCQYEPRPMDSVQVGEYERRPLIPNIDRSHTRAILPGIKHKHSYKHAGLTHVFAPRHCAGNGAYIPRWTLS